MYKRRFFTCSIVGILVCIIPSQQYASVFPLPSYAGNPYDIAIVDSNFLLSTDSGLVILGPAGSISPSVKGFCQLDGWGFSLVVRNRLAYVGGANSSTLHVVDIQNPSAPTRIGGVNDNLGGVWDITLNTVTDEKTIAMLATTAGLALYDLSNPIDPSLQSIYSPYDETLPPPEPIADLDDYYTTGFYYDTSTLYLYVRTDSCAGELGEEVLIRNIPRKTDAIFATGTIATLLYYDETSCGAGIYLKSIDISNPEQTHCIDSMALFSHGCALAGENSLLLAGHHRGVDCITVSATGQFSNPYNITNQFAVEGIQIVNGIAFISGNPRISGSSESNGKLMIMDLRTAATPEVLYEISLEGKIAGIAVYDTTVYIAGERAVHIVPFTPPQGYTSVAVPSRPSIHHPQPITKETGDAMVFSITGRKYGAMSYFSGNLPEGCYILSITKNGRRLITKQVHLNP